MLDLPELGIGVVYMPSLEPLFEVGHNLIDVIEIEPQAYWFQSSSKNRSYHLNSTIFQRFCQYPQAKIVHSVGFPVGGTTFELDFLPSLCESIERLGAAWASEHLSFNRVTTTEGEFNTGFLLPPLQTPETVKIAAANIRQLSAQLPVPFAFETGVNYMRPHPAELSDGQFFGAVAEEANCGILLDLHNLWTNEQNGRQSVWEALREIPLERVWEIHLAGGRSFKGYWLDAHSGLVPGAVMKLAAEIIPHLPNLKAIIFEVIDEYIQAYNLTQKILLEQLQHIRQLWNLRSSSTRIWYSKSNLVQPLKSDEDLPQTAVWETALGKLVTVQASDTPLYLQLSQDPAVKVFQELIFTARTGMIVGSLKFTSRFLILHLGASNFRQLLQAFWKIQPPQLFSSSEAQNFAVNLKMRSLNIPHLDEILDFELAWHRVKIDELAQKVQFSCDPKLLLNALNQRRLPEVTTPGEFEMLILPDSDTSPKFQIFRKKNHLDSVT
ncbi:MAG: DUF692 family multinuclear iron-containing protein [Cyanobacteria bacterium J06592_8]